MCRVISGDKDRRKHRRTDRGGQRPKPHHIIREHDQHSFNSIRVLLAGNFVQFGLSLPHNNQLDFVDVLYSLVVT